MEINKDATQLMRNGYKIKKSKISNEVLEKIKTDLSFVPEVNSIYQKSSIFDSFFTYRENKDYIIIPRFYGYTKWNLDPRNFKNKELGKDIDIDYTKQLRENQTPIINTALEKLNTVGGIVISAPCGEGKTAMALNLVCVLKKKTLIIVHNENLLDQWRERISFFTNTLTVGEIRGKKMDVDHDIVIAMLQTISMKSIPLKIFEDFGLVCVDECHHIGAKVFSQALPKVSTKYMIGLSATPDRKDGLSRVFFYYLGDIGYRKKLTRDYDVDVKIIQMHNDKFKPIICIGTVNPILMISNLVNIKERNMYIVNLIRDLSKTNRQILALTQRRNHAIEISKHLTDLNIENGIVMGTKTKKEKKERELAYDKQVLVATYNLVSEGFDCPRLDTLVMMTPIKDIEQTVGRILRRQSYEENNPLVVDIVDNVRPFIGQGNTRKRYYKKHKKPTFQIVEEEKIFGEKKKDLEITECLL